MAGMAGGRVVIEALDILIKAGPWARKKYQNHTRSRRFCRHLARCLYEIYDDEIVLAMPKKQKGKINRLLKEIYETEIDTDELYRLFHDRLVKLDTISEKEKVGQIAPLAPLLNDWLCDMKPAEVSCEDYLDKVIRSDITELFRFGPSEYEHLNTMLKEKYDE